MGKRGSMCHPRGRPLAHCACRVTHVAWCLYIHRLMGQRREPPPGKIPTHMQHSSRPVRLLLRKRFVVTTRAQLHWKAALTIPRGACAFVDAMCCGQAFTWCTTRCHSPPMPAACTVPWSGDAVCSYSTPLAHPRRHTCFVSLALAELRVCKGLGVVCLRMVRVVYPTPSPPLTM